LKIGIRQRLAGVSFDTLLVVMRRREFLSSPLLPIVARAKSKGNAALKNLIVNLEKKIPELLQEAKVPGLSIAVIEDAKLQWRRGFGVKDSGSREPVDNHTMFEAGSLSKTVFAYAVMKLCEKRVIDLDTPLTHYTVERFLQGDPRLGLITARHVLSHTSGFQNWREEGKEPLTIHFTPGEKYLYSGEGYSYLQSVVTHLTGQPFELYMKANLFAPFGMASSGYVWNDRFEQRMARPHSQSGKPMENKKSTTTSVARYGSAGALLTTPTDYARFIIEVTGGKKSDAFRLSRKSLEEMLRPQVKVSDSNSWALGWGIQHTDKGDFISMAEITRGFMP
jgi:CubicO group peptidase (beta-lactamase class C family)